MKQALSDFGDEVGSDSVKIIAKSYCTRSLDQESGTVSCGKLKPPETFQLQGDDSMGNTLRKGDMTRRVAESMGCSDTEGEKALNAVIKSIMDAMRAGDRIVLTGFGTFERKKVKARRVRSIRGGRSGELIDVPAHTRVRFRAGARLSQVARE